MERLYMTVLIGLMGFGKHIARLRSWREKRRTAYFCAVSQFLQWSAPDLASVKHNTNDLHCS